MHLINGGMILLNVVPGLVCRDEICEIGLRFVQTVLHIEMLLATKTESFAGNI